MFKITPAAAEQILRAAQNQPGQPPEPDLDELPALRVAAKIDDDGEIAYGMGFDEERENDVLLDCEGVQVLISPRSQELLMDTALDFVELHPGEFQFIFVSQSEGGSAPGCPSQNTRGCGGCGGGCS